MKSNLRSSAQLGLLLLAALGCAPSAAKPQNALQGVDPKSVVERGQLRFIDDSVLGRRVANERGLPCLLFFTAQWCTYCHQMEATAFQDRSVGKLAKQFVCVLVDADREPAVCQEYAIDGFPTILFLAADGRPLHRLVGRQPTPELISGMQAALQRVAWLEDTKVKLR